MSLVLTVGEPAGIGPDLTVQLAAAGELRGVLVVADPRLLQQRASLLGLDIEVYETDQPDEQHMLCVYPIAMAMPCPPGQPQVDNAAYVLATLDYATQRCLQGHSQALITAPVHKGIINQAGIPFTGHTEFLAKLSRAQPVMMLACSQLKVALVTTHLPLQQVSAAITAEKLRRVIQILYADLQRRFGLAEPKILVCGLNPHAGEGGHLGREEIDIIEPVLEELRQQGLHLIGPVPADTAFNPPQLEQVDVVLSMYHDQGLPVLKSHCFGQSVNITLGLPFIRTSVDHGTALELAGTGKAQTSSLKAAIEQARLILARSSDRHSRRG